MLRFLTIGAFLGYSPLRVADTVGPGYGSDAGARAPAADRVRGARHAC